MGFYCEYCRLHKAPFEPDTVLLSFPKDPNLRNQWCTVLGLDESNISARSKLCSDHFERRLYENSGNRIILEPKTYPDIERTLAKPDQGVSLHISEYNDSSCVPLDSAVRDNYTRQDFMTESVYEEFLKYKDFRDRKISGLQEKLCRNEEKIKIIERQIAILQEAEN